MALLEDPATLRKTIFLFNSLLIENKQFGVDLLKQDGLNALDAVLVKYTEQEQDEDMVEKVHNWGIEY